MDTLYFDGWVAPKNPGVRGGAVVADRNGNEIDSVTREYEGITNNQTEAMGLWLACKHALEGSTVVGDSQLVIRRANDIAQNVKRKRKGKWDEIVGKAVPYILQKRLNVTWVPREYNLAGHINEKRYGC